jgi:GNAT superfamily N-acetyltransferase
VIQDVIVRPDHQRTGIGSVMVGRCLRVHEHVRQITLMADDEPTTRAFCESLGFEVTTEHGQVAYLRTL